MHAFWATLLRQGIRREGSTGRPGGPGLGRLLLEELAWAAREAVHPVKMAAAGLVVVGVGVGLGPTTPGPVLGAGWRLAVSVLLGLVALATAHALLQRRTDDDGLRALRVVLAATAVLVVGTMVVGTLLAVITSSEPDQVEHLLEVSLAIDRPLLVGAALLVAGILVAGIGNRLAIPGALLFLGLGMLIGSDGLELVNISDAGMVQSIGVVALVIILFDGGLGTDADRLRRGLIPGLALGTVGVAVTAGVTAIGTMWLLGAPSRLAWLIGAIVASTDAAAVLPLLRRVKVPNRVADALRLESGVNDPIAVLLTVGLLSSWDAPSTASAWIGFGALQLIGALAVGTAVGWAGAWLLRRVDLGTGGLYPVLALGVAGLAYGAAVAAGASGFLAFPLAAFVLAGAPSRRPRSVQLFVGALSSGAEVGLFLLLGLLVSPGELPGVAGTALAVSAVLVFVARPLAVWLSLTWFDMSLREMAAVSWLGLRGAVPIVLATLAFSSGLPEAAVVFDVVFFVVLTSALVQGLTAMPVIRKLGLPAQDGPSRSVEIMPLEDAGVDVAEVVVDADSSVAGRLLSDSGVPEGLLVSAIVRGDRVLVPRGSTRLLVGDLLVITTADQQYGSRDVQAWVRGNPVA